MGRFFAFPLFVFIVFFFFIPITFSQNSSGQEKLKLTIKSQPLSSSTANRTALPIISEGPTEIIRLSTLPGTAPLPNFQSPSPIPTDQEDVGTVQEDHFEITLFPTKEYISADDTLVIQGIITQPAAPSPTNTSTASEPKTTPPPEPVEIQYALEDEKGNVVLLEKETVPPHADFFFRKQLRIQPEMESGKFRLVVGVAKAAMPQAATVSRIAFSPEKKFLDFSSGIIIGILGGTMFWGYLKWSLRV